MKLSIIIPAHNEEKTIETVLGLVEAVDIAPWEKEIIVVNDGSGDGTWQILENLQKLKNFILLNHKKNLGKGAAIKTALEKVSGDFVIIQDADLEYQPADFPALLQALNSGNRVVFGDRGIKRYPERGFHYVIGAKILTWSVNLLYGARLRDLYTGYKLIPSALIKGLNLQSSGFEFEAEVACKILKQGIQIKEVPINYMPRSKQQGKHIRFKDAVVGLWTIVKFRLK
jgi:glycosyltransferase involved in cell wall biosynthesis